MVPDSFIYKYLHLCWTDNTLQRYFSGVITGEHWQVIPIGKFIEAAGTADVTGANIVDWTWTSLNVYTYSTDNACVEWWFNRIASFNAVESVIRASQLVDSRCSSMTKPCRPIEAYPLSITHTQANEFHSILKCICYRLHYLGSLAIRHKLQFRFDTIQDYRYVLLVSDFCTAFRVRSHGRKRNCEKERAKNISEVCSTNFEYKRNWNVIQ